jgi:hypothetical protein
MVGQQIFLGRYYYPIAAVNSGTELELEYAYEDDTISGGACRIVTPTLLPGLRKLVIRNGTSTYGIFCSNCLEILLDDLIIYGCNEALFIEYTSYPKLITYVVSNESALTMNSVGGFKIDWSSFDYSTTGRGVVMNNCGEGTMMDASAKYNNGGGMQISNSSNMTFFSLNIDDNTGIGVEFSENNNDLQLVGVNANGNTSDGIKLTATTDRLNFVGVGVTNNGGYGININAATCDKNVLVAPRYDGNVSGTLRNLGTGTVIL